MDHDLIANLFLFAVALVPLVWLILRYWRTRYTPIQYVLYCICVALVKFQWRATLPSRFPLPRNSGAVLIANHCSSVDPFFVQASSDRPVHWMVAKEYCDHPRFKWFLRQCEVIPTGRMGVDTAAIKSAIRLASSGEYVAMFPEGRINLTGGKEFMLPVRPGAIMIALRAGVPVVPLYIKGSPYGNSAGSPLRMRARVRVRYGKPIDLSACKDRENDDQTVRQLLVTCVREIAKLAGRDDFVPQLAGRQWLPADEEAFARKLASEYAPNPNG